MRSKPEVDRIGRKQGQDEVRNGLGFCSRNAFILWLLLNGKDSFGYANICVIDCMSDGEFQVCVARLVSCHKPNRMNAHSVSLSFVSLFARHIC